MHRYKYRLYFGLLQATTIFLIRKYKHLRVVTFFSSVIRKCLCNIVLIERKICLDRKKLLQVSVNT